MLAAQSRWSGCIAESTLIPAPAIELAGGEGLFGVVAPVIVDAGGRVTSFWWAGLRSSP